MKNTVSIIIPMYNAETLILKTLHSLKKQTKNCFEVIIIDDGSTDKSVSVVSNYINQNKDMSIKLYCQANAGPSKARNTGIQRSNTKYIMFVDSDDQVHPDFVEQMLNEIETGEYQLVTCGINKKIKGKEVFLKMDAVEIEDENKIANKIEGMLEAQIFNYVWNKIYLLEIIRENQILFDEKLSMGEDFLFNLDYIKKIRNMKIIPNILYIYEADESFLTNKIRENDFENRKNNIIALEEYYKENGISIDLSFQYIKILYSEIFNDFKKNGMFSFKKNVENIRVLLDKKEIEKVRVRYKKNSKLNDILFYPIKKRNIICLYLISLSAFIGKKYNLTSFKSKSM